jgi:hypothetical protein
MTLVMLRIQQVGYLKVHPGGRCFNAPADVARRIVGDLDFDQPNVLGSAIAETRRALALGEGTCGMGAIR